MIPLRTLTLAALSLLVSTTSHALAPAWPHEGSDLKPDATTVYGRLDNGLRYVVHPNAEPPGRASLRLYMDVGSLMEEDDQQGMAHFLEHMAFNGSRTYPDGGMVEYFQRLGMGFGADTNAHTSFKETVYMLELPKVEPKFITDGLRLFRDDLDGMLLRPEEIDRERGIILSEKLSRDSIEYRTMLAGYKFALPDSLLPERMPIGKEEVIKSMTPERFRDFYRKWYGPKRAVIVAVGDFKDTKVISAEIEKTFGDAKSAGENPRDPDLGKIPSGTGLIANLHTEMEAQAVNISIENVRAAKNKPDNAATRRENLVRSLADSMLNQRLSKLAKAKDAPFLSAEGYSYEYLEFVRINGIGGQCAPEKWQPTLALIEQELRRALDHGFTKAEFEEARSNVLRDVKLRADQASTRQSRNLASGLVTLLASKKVFTHPSDDLVRTQATLATLTAEECHEAMKADWDSKDLQIFVGGNLKLEGDAAAQIIASYNQSHAVPLTAPAQEETAAFAYTNFGPAGKVANRVEVADLEVTQIAFENNVRLNIKPTPFEKGGIRVIVSFGGGKLTAPKDKPGLIPFAQSTFELGGLEAHDVDALRRIFADKTVGADFAVGDDSFMLSGRTTPEDLATELQLLAATLTAPGYREEAQDQYRKNLEPLYTQLNHTAEGVMNDRVVAFLHSGDYRFGFPAIEVMRQRNLEELKAWLSPELSNGYLEIAIVGDVKVDAAIAAVASTFGALPKRAEKKPAYTEERAIPFPEPPQQKEFDFTTEIPKAITGIYWPTADMSDIKRTRRLISVGSILDDRLRIKVREELGETYSPACYHVASDTFTGYGYMTAMIELKPEQAEQIAKLVAAIGTELAKGPITDDEFDRAMKPQLSQLEQMRRDNRYWSQNVLRNCQEQPQRLDWARTILDDFAKITKEDLQKLAAEYLASGHTLTVNLQPKTEAKP